MDTTAYLVVRPPEAEPLEYLCWLDNQRKRYNESLIDCSRAIGLDPQNARLYLTRGVARSNLKDSQGALADYNASIGLDPTNALTFFNRGVEEEVLGDNIAAAGDYRRALAIDPSETRAQGNLSRLQARLTAGAAQPPPAGPVLRPTSPAASKPKVPALALPPLPPLPDLPPLPGTGDGAAPGGTLPAPLRVDAQVNGPRKIAHVEPVYPPVAVAARAQGVVLIDVTIGPDGKVLSPVVTKSIPLLDQAAIDAVRQWRFEPIAERRPVIMTVTLTFALR